jgi:hypothetical protein
MLHPHPSAGVITLRELLVVALFVAVVSGSAVAMWLVHLPVAVITTGSSAPWCTWRSG